MIAIATAYRWTYGELTTGHNDRPGLVPSVLHQISGDWHWYISADPNSEQLEELRGVAANDDRITLQIEAESTDIIGLRKQQAFAMVGSERWHISLDSDDYLLPEAVAVFTDASTEIDHKNQSTAAIAARYRKHHLNGSSYDVRPPRSLTFDALRIHCWLHPSGWCYRVASIQEIGGYRTDLYVGEDYHLQARLAYAFGDVAICERTLYGRICRKNRYSRMRWNAAVVAVSVDLNKLALVQSC